MVELNANQLWEAASLNIELDTQLPVKLCHTGCSFFLVELKGLRVFLLCHQGGGECLGVGFLNIHTLS